MSTVSTVYEYRIYCITESAYVTTWTPSTNPPTTCPNNNTHTINTNSTVIINTVSQNTVFVQPSTGITNGNYRSISYYWTFAPGTSTQTLSWPFNILISSMTFMTTSNNTGDTINTFIIPNTVIGTITAPITSGATSFVGDSTTVANLEPGFLVSVNNISMGQVVSISGNTVTTDTSASTNIASGSIVTMSINNLQNFALGPAGTIPFSAKGSQPLTLLAHHNIALQYTNTGLVSKTFWVYAEIFY